jgi:hypothetical protein
MARRNITLAIAIVFALVALLPARGQTGSAVTTTLSNLMFGVDPTDSTKTWTTTLRLTNRTPNAVHSEIDTFFDNSGNQLPSPLLTSSVYGGTGAAVQEKSYISPLSENREILAGLTPTTVAILAEVTVEALQNADGLPDIVASATVQEADANGNIVRSYEVVDPTTVARNPGQGFAVGADIGVDGVDTVLALSGPACARQNVASASIGLPKFPGRRPPVRACRDASAANVTVSIYDGYNIATSNHAPMASVTFRLSAGGLVSTTISQLFAQNAALIAAFANPPLMGNGQPDYMLQQLVTVTSDQPITLGVSMLNANPDGSLVTTAAHAFPLASQ